MRTSTIAIGNATQIVKTLYHLGANFVIQSYDDCATLPRFSSSNSMIKLNTHQTNRITANNTCKPFEMREGNVIYGVKLTSSFGEHLLTPKHSPLDQPA